MREKESNLLSNRVKRALDEKAKALDPHVAEALKTARYRALAEKEKSTPRSLRPILFPIGGLVLATLIAVVLIFLPKGPSPKTPYSPADVKCVEILSSEQGADLKFIENLDLYENLKFYQWLANQKRLENEDTGGWRGTGNSPLPFMSCISKASGKPQREAYLSKMLQWRRPS